MNNSDKLAAIREACAIARNPKATRSEIARYVISKEFRLADVLLAIMKKKDGCTQGEMKNILLSLAYLWNCFSDSLDWHAEHQPETVDFLYDVLEQK